MRSSLKFTNLAISTLFALTVFPDLIPHTIFPAAAQTAEPHKAEEDRVLQQCRRDLDENQYEAALQSCNQALATFQQLQNPGGEAKAVMNLGIAYGSLSQYEKAIAYHEQARLLYQQVKDRNGEADALNDLGIGYRFLSQYEKAIAYHEQALPIYQQVKNRNGEANVLMGLGVAYRFLSQYEKAIAYYEQALPIFQQVKDRNGEANVLMKLGNAYSSLLKYEKAIAYYEQALPIFQQVKDRNGEAWVLNNLGSAYLSLSQYQEAITYYEQALPIFQQAKNRYAEADILTNLGSLHRSLAQYQKAIVYYEQALPIFQQIEDHAGETDVLIGLGGTYRYLSQHQKAIGYYEQALLICQQVKDHHRKAAVWQGLGTVYRSLSQYQKAISYYEQALPIYQQFKDRDGKAYLLTHLGKTYYHLSQYQKAISYYEQALPIFQQVKDRKGEGWLFSNLGDLFAQRNEPELAIMFYKQSINAYESIRQHIRNLPREIQESYTQSVAGTYRALADLLIAQGRIGEAQQVLERLKIQELNDFTKGTRAPTAIADVGFNPVETQVKGKYASLVAFGGKFYECEQQQPRCPQHGDLKTQYDSLSKEFQDFVEQIKQQLRDSRLSQVDDSTQDFLNSADRVVTAHPNSILIYPLVLADKTRILWASKGGVLSKTAVCPLGEKALYDKVAEFQSLISKQGDETQLKAVGKDLYDCLVKPVENELAANGIKHLIFVPDRATNYIPMGALFDGKQYLIQRFAISNILSASLTDTDSKLTAPQATPILALGLSEARGNYNALPNVEAELNAIVKQTNNPGIYPGQIFLNQTFTKDAFENNIHGHKIIHIATHGEFKPENPRSSYFLLGTGTPYPIPDVQTLRDLKDVHLVVLSACKTGLGGADGLGLEVSGISSFFMGDRDRAKAVMASLWDVNDASTSLLMQQFYQNLALGKMTKVEALRQAQLSLLQEKVNAKDAAALARAGARRYVPGQHSVDSLVHPYYWAPFILIGNGL
jgi:CHAT domain-containing protein/uncharacterized protein HemY